MEAGLVSALHLFDRTEPQQVNSIENTRMMILLCDGDASYTEKTLQRAKESKIRIYPVLIGSTSGMAALEHIAEVTGGTFYYAATAEEIREAIFGVQQETIGQIDKTDSDHDGLYDIYETAGMMLPNGKYVYTDPSNRDTDGDGLSDAEEMGVLEKFDEQPVFKQHHLKLQGFDDEVYAEYFDYKSDPTKKDTDGDGDNDDVDPSRLVYRLNGYFTENITLIEQLAEDYYDGIDLFKYNLKKEKWYVFMFLRQFNPSYTNKLWDGIGGKIEYGFLTYVEGKNKNLYSYFENLDYIYANEKKELVDIRHLAATVTALIYETNLSDGLNIKDTIQKQFMPESYIDNLAGWAGDLHTLMNDVYREDEYPINTYNGFYIVFKKFLCNSAHSFSQMDMYADTDAYNIYKLIKKKSIGSAFKSYYEKGYKARFKKFTNGWSKWSLKNLVGQFTETNFAEVIRWPLLDYDFSAEQSKAARDAFVNYLLEEREKE